MKLAVIGGTNIDVPPFPYRERAVSTPYGDAVVFISKMENGNEFLFLSRHSVLSPRDPGEINYRANVYALYKLGVTHIIGISSVGTCDYTFHLGSLCLISDFIDFTKSRPASFEREHRKFRHTSMENVFNTALNDELEKMILERGIPYSGRTIYACTEGPRFETSAEVRILRMLGAQIVGMTLIPEAPLCKDLGMDYTAIGIVANYCTGMTGEVTDSKIDSVMQERRKDTFDLCLDFLDTMQGSEK